MPIISLSLAFINAPLSHSTMQIYQQALENAYLSVQMALLPESSHKIQLEYVNQSATFLSFITLPIQQVNV